MRVLNRLLVCTLCFVALIGCRESASLPDPNHLVTSAWQAWRNDWHAVWQFEWTGAPLRGPLVVEIWHAADGRRRIEVLEAPSAALSGLTLVEDGTTGWLYDLRQARLETGPVGQVSIPLASDALNAIDWLLSGIDDARVKVAGHDALESGPAAQLKILLSGGDQAVLWVHDETGLPARLELQSAVWGEASFTTRSIAAPEPLSPQLFVVP